MRLLGHSISDIANMIRQAGGEVTCSGLEGSEQAYLLYRLHRVLVRPLFVLCGKPKEAERLARDIRFFSGKANVPVLTFPSYDILPFQPVAYHPKTACKRIETLYRMLTGFRPSIVITTAGALLQRVIPREVLSRYAEYVVAGEEMEREPLVNKLIQGGYQETVLVEDPGDFALRGGLIDLFPPFHSDPIRIEFFGDMVESIRAFSAADQRSLKALSDVTILPAAETVLNPSDMDRVVDRVRKRGGALEMAGLRIEGIVDRLQNLDQFPGIGGLLSLIHPSLDTLFDYLPPETLPVVIDPAALENVAFEMEETLTKSYLSARNDGRLCVDPEALCLTWPDVKARLAGSVSLSLKTIPVVETAAAACSVAVERNHLVTQQLRRRGQGEDLMRPLVDWIKNAGENGLAPFLLSRTVRQAERLEDLLGPYHVQLRHLRSFPEEPHGDKRPSVCLGELSSGFAWAREGLAIITDEEIFGAKYRLRSAPKRDARPRWVTFEDLKADDLVVHTEHGIGRYKGLIKLDVANISNDFMLIEYRDGDRLYVPVDRMNCVQKYVGVDGVAPRLEKMGGKSWERIKERVKKSVRKTAGELLKLYAARSVQKGHAFSPPDRSFEEFEAAFEYAETPDQGRAIRDVMADMGSSVPMDRLICGDVGYGKTEIALRAAFRVVWDNKQVAFLVPTTVLAEQHYKTFKERFDPYPVEIETLSRFRSAGEQRTVVNKLKEGKADIVIGTHRLLQKDVAFRDLGLVIIDEEQRFGVTHKEKLKQLRRLVDVLALTATPIPRTLHMSLMGIRDLSIIATPPEYRYAIKTYISAYDDTVVAEAIQKELQRDGQIFFVHNKIQSIWGMARHLESLVPGLRVGVAHGRLSDEELEAVMLDFLHKEIDLLVCTTIIESGLDFPSANTILINRADKFGLAQIYQLRGRVGRADEQAYAYLFIPHEGALTKDAKKRLKVLMEHSDMGAGFQIAMSDLQIRGGGTILGPTQSGHIASVGYEMYIQLMERAVREMKGEPAEPELDPEIKVNWSAYIPEAYVPAIDQRLESYKRLARMTETSEVEAFCEEFRDRFGPLPEPAKALADKILLKVMCRKLGIHRLDLTDQRLVVSFAEACPVSPEKITALVRTSPRRFSLTPQGVLTIRMPSGKDAGPFEAAKKVLQDLA